MIEFDNFYIFLNLVKTLFKLFFEYFEWFFNTLNLNVKFIFFEENFPISGGENDVLEKFFKGEI